VYYRFSADSLISHTPSAMATTTTCCFSPSPLEVAPETVWYCPPQGGNPRLGILTDLGDRFSLVDVLTREAVAINTNTLLKGHVPAWEPKQDTYLPPVDGGVTPPADSTTFGCNVLETLGGLEPLTVAQLRASLAAVPRPAEPSVLTSWYELLRSDIEPFADLRRFCRDRYSNLNLFEPFECGAAVREFFQAIGLSNNVLGVADIRNAANRGLNLL
jgi:hypothetical protein